MLRRVVRCGQGGDRVHTLVALQRELRQFAFLVLLLFHRLIDLQFLAFELAHRDLLLRSCRVQHAQIVRLGMELITALFEVQPLHAQCFELVAEFLQQGGETGTQWTQTGRARRIDAKFAQPIVLRADLRILVTLLAKQRLRLLTIAHPVGPARCRRIGRCSERGTRLGQCCVYFGAQRWCGRELCETRRRRFDAGRKSTYLLTQRRATYCLARAFLERLKINAQAGERCQFQQHAGETGCNLLRLVYSELRTFHVTLRHFDQRFGTNSDRLQFDIARAPPLRVAPKRLCLHHLRF